ncbi:MAG: CoA-transferase subunit beta [Cryobacterium sp.]|nr:CoA-transferase subunit beta [Oligoflexia bacterium]
MVVRAAEELHDHDVVFVGIGLPNLACNLARASHAPDLFMIYESGAVGAIPERLPVSIGDPALVTDSLSIASQADIFQNYLQNGLIEVGFLGGAQIDRYGNINTTVIGDYENPKVRLPGSGGACEIAVHAKRVLIVMRMSPKTFVEKCDFVTSPGSRFESKRPSLDLGKNREELGLPGGGPTTVITDVGVCEFLNTPGSLGKEMVLTEIFDGVEVSDVLAKCGWELQIAPNLKKIPAPKAETLSLIRDRLDPQKLFL